ncbi:hypothetical protein NIES4102_31320 [Chondrocystis sp. NIES-4102]|nr:hypothetical protein NIES4102_31320 [Chondrocystis sp. NIES-4102]
MSSIFLSFVGNQDPGSDRNGQEGSIVTLIRHLLEQKHDIKKIFLLYTFGTKEAAKLTKEWLLLLLTIPPEKIEIIAVDEQLSQDPINLLLAVQEARKAIARAQEELLPGDRLEFNSSSGTPAMKSSWSIIQASGLAFNTHLWQVRDPERKLDHQQQVFESDISVLKKTIDLQTIKKQLAVYNYNGALTTLNASNLIDNSDSNDNLIIDLLKSASLRLNSAFESSFNIIKKHEHLLDEYFWQQSKNLRDRQHGEILKEIYFQAEIKAKNEDYSELLVKIFVFQESVLFYLLKQHLLPRQDINLAMNDNLKNKLTAAIQSYAQGDLQKYLNNYRLANGQKLLINNNYNRTVMTVIIQYCCKNNSKIINLLNKFERYCQQRNEYIHQLKGIDKLEAETILKDLNEILKFLTIETKNKPFELINQTIEQLLEKNQEISNNNHQLENKK